MSSLLHTKIAAISILLLSIIGEKYCRLPFLTVIGIVLVYLRYPRSHWGLVLYSVVLDALFGHRAGITLFSVCIILCCVPLLRIRGVGTVLFCLFSLLTQVLLTRVLMSTVAIDARFLITAVFFIFGVFVYSHGREGAYKEL